MTNLAVFGLALDIAGVLFLGAALAATAGRSIKNQAGTYYNYNAEVLWILSQQKTDALFGLPLLVLGFSLQALAALGVSTSPNTTLIIAGITVAGLGGCLSARRVVGDWYYSRLKAEMDK